jgi:hypothetical protein
MAVLWRLLRALGDVRAAQRGPQALGARYVRRRAHRALARAMRRRGL